MSKNYSVIICAFNEEKNILNLISQIQAQNLQPLELIVVNDCSTDKTKELLETQKGIILINNPVNLGKPKSFNLGKNQATADVLVFFDADITITNKDLSREILKSFENDDKLALIGGNPTPFMNLQPKTPTMLASIGSFFVVHNLKTQFEDHLLQAHGRILAMSRNYYQNLEVPKTVADDQFIYLKSKEYGNFKFLETAKVYYKTPMILQDYLIQSQRFGRTENEIKTYFSKGIVDKYSTTKPINKLKAMFKTLITHPIYFSFWLWFFVYSRFLVKKTVSQNWGTANSTK
jgi:glycosyltransferase involved in cell wall biosynthesis